MWDQLFEKRLKKDLYFQNHAHTENRCAVRKKILFPKPCLKKHCNFFKRTKIDRHQIDTSALDTCMQ